MTLKFLKLRKHSLGLAIKFLKMAKPGSSTALKIDAAICFGDFGSSIFIIEKYVLPWST